MAHYAQLGVDNIVVKVWTLDNINSMTAGGIEKDEIGQAYLKEHHGDLTLVKCSYNTSQGVHSLGGTPFITLPSSSRYDTFENFASSADTSFSLTSKSLCIATRIK